MVKFANLSLLVLFVLLLCAAPALAQDGAPAAGTGAAVTADDDGIGFNARYLGAGLVVIGAGYGIGKLAGSALESMARQPEVAGNIQTAMIIAAALIEGFTFFALVICWFGPSN